MIKVKVVKELTNEELKMYGDDLIDRCRPEMFMEFADEIYKSGVLPVHERKVVKDDPKDGYIELKIEGIVIELEEFYDLMAGAFNTINTYPIKREEIVEFIREQQEKKNDTESSTTDRKTGG